MRIETRLYVRLSRAHLVQCILVSGFAVLQGCAVIAPSCDGRFEPINVPDATGGGGADERSTSEEDAS